MSRNTEPGVAFRGVEIERELDARGDARGQVAKRDLDRYYSLLAQELATIALTEAETNLLRDACNGIFWELTSIRLLWAEVADAIRLNRLDAKWDVDGAALVVKLQALTAAQTFAVVDAVERWWRDPHRTA